MPHPPRVPIVLLAAACVALLSLGCKKDAEPPSFLARAEIELSDAKVTMRAGAFACEVKYRFTKGQPNPVLWYVCQIDVKDSGVGFFARKQGKDLQPEGTLRGEVANLKKQGGKDYEISMQEATHQDGPFHKASNVLAGSAQ